MLLKNKIKFIVIGLALCQSIQGLGQSVAREWNEMILESIRNDFARPTIHARNLFHTSVAMYDIWAIFDEEATPYLLGNTRGRFVSQFENTALPALVANKDLEKSISFALYRIVLHRYKEAPGIEEIRISLDDYMERHEYDIYHLSSDYLDGDPGSFGNFIGTEVIRYGLLDGSNEQNDYASDFYLPTNMVLNPNNNSGLLGLNPNYWQPLLFDRFFDQAGNPLPGAIPEFLGPEWGNVEGFGLQEEDRTIYEKDSNTYIVYHDPGPPDYYNTSAFSQEKYEWGFNLVLKWSSQLDTQDSVYIDISPVSIGNISEFPETFEEYKEFYKPEGGDGSQGHSINPATNHSYQAQQILRGDYARILAEFWADGPDSETPPGHWFTILNYVMDQEIFERKYNGKIELGELEYDIKAYFTLGGAMHDAAISAWSIKGYYDYIRPISALRYMASMGQSTDPNLPSYSENGMPLVDDLVELVQENDPDFPDEMDVGKIKFYAWRGPTFVDEPDTDVAGVGWILGEDWWPYQRPSFITPPFAGYVSGHSTFSRAAAEVLTYLTGDAFFPNGLGEFSAQKNEFLVFEDGPSEDVVLQWATYRDASDQCSLSRIWGGIHPPIDDIRGRQIGIKVADKAIEIAEQYFEGRLNIVVDQGLYNVEIYPNPSSSRERVFVTSKNQISDLYVFDFNGRFVMKKSEPGYSCDFSTEDFNSGLYYIIIESTNFEVIKKLVIL